MAPEETAAMAARPQIAAALVEGDTLAPGSRSTLPRAGFGGGVRRRHSLIDVGARDFGAGPVRRLGVALLGIPRRPFVIGALYALGVLLAQAAVRVVVGEDVVLDETRLWAMASYLLWAFVYFTVSLAATGRTFGKACSVSWSSSPSARRCWAARRCSEPSCSR